MCSSDLHCLVLAFPVNGRLQALSAGKPGSATAPDSLSLFHFNKNFYAEAQRWAQTEQATGNEFRVIAGRQALRGIQDTQNLGETLHAIGQGFNKDCNV